MDDLIASSNLDGALRACREAMRTNDIRDGFTMDHLREPLRLVSICAHRDGVPPEQVLVQLKRLVEGMPALDELPPDRRDQVRTRVIQLAISAYFADSDPS